ncbi:helix-turn-helix domain-containing protein [Janibacter terrae]|uniref:Helix-turn-helix domain-containing protein n=1 Tax=Janibacter terrae TaxID=103817 RepID=A0ABZ2FC59_9MICO|nr:helix-turn-helix domain-containing protein [Janibacter terrae]
MPRRGLVSLTTRRQVRRSGGELATAATQRLEATHEWYTRLSAQERSWVALVAQAGISNFIDWLDGIEPADTRATFGAAPRELTRTINLAQTLELARTVVDVVEEQVESLARPKDVTDLRIAVLRYAREIAFGAAEVYAQAAEQRGAWDARLESLVIDAVMRGEVDESIRSRAAALGWGEVADVVVLVGNSPHPAGGEDPAAAIIDVHRAGNRLGLPVLAGVQGNRLVAVLGGVTEPAAAAAGLAGCFADGDLVHGPRVADLGEGALSAHAAVAGHLAAPGWPARPRPVAADDLLGERAVAGDDLARATLVENVQEPLEEHPSLLETARTHLDSTGLEATARALIVHVNTVRYRLGRITELIGYDLTDPHEAFTVRVGLTIGAILEDASKNAR